MDPLDAKDVLADTKRAFFAGKASEAELRTAAESYRASIAAWAKAKGRRVALPSVAHLLR